MRKQNDGSIVIVAILTVTLIGLGVLLFFTKTRGSSSSTILQVTITPSANKIIGDINHDGSANEEDKNIVKPYLGCKTEEDCWNKVIGKTEDGDNPYYVFDLDLNKDGIVNEQDIALIGK